MGTESSVGVAARSQLPSPGPVDGPKATADPPKHPGAPIRRAIVLYGTRFGNTERVAAALAKGLRTAAGVEVDCRSLEERPENLGEYDLVAVGGPTEILSASRSMKKFLAQLPPRSLEGRRGFAFDTRLAGRLSGSAARVIEHHLERLGAEIVRPAASATVRGMNKDERARYGEEGAPEWVRKLDKSGSSSPHPPTRIDLLLPGAESEFERIGAELGARLLPLQA